MFVEFRNKIETGFTHRTLCVKRSFLILTFDMQAKNLCAYVVKKILLLMLNYGTLGKDKKV